MYVFTLTISHNTRYKVAVFIDEIEIMPENDFVRNSTTYRSELDQNKHRLRIEQTGTFDSRNTLRTMIDNLEFNFSASKSLGIIYDWVYAQFECSITIHRDATLSAQVDTIIKRDSLNRKIVANEIILGFGTNVRIENQTTELPIPKKFMAGWFIAESLPIIVVYSLPLIASIIVLIHSVLMRTYNYVFALSLLGCVLFLTILSYCELRVVNNCRNNFISKNLSDDN